MKKSSWWITQQLGSALRSLLVSVVLPPLVMLRRQWTREGPPRIGLRREAQSQKAWGREADVGRGPEGALSESLQTQDAGLGPGFTDQETEA